MPEGTLEGRVALVTGGSRGIGRAVVRRLVAEGARVRFSYASNRHEAEQLVADSQGRASAVGCDMRDRDALSRLVPDTLDAEGRLDIVIANAGITRDGLLVRMKDDEWDDVLAVNLTGAVLTMRSALKPMMKARFGRMVVLSSVAGLHGNPGQVNYSAAKAGLVGAVKALAREVGSRGITVNAIAPGFIETDMTAFLDGARKQMEELIPAGRFGTPDEVASLAWYLSLPESAYITGQSFQIDGGLAP